MCSIRRACAESPAERSALHGDAAGGRSQGSGQPDGSRTRCAPPRPAFRASLHLLLAEMRSSSHRLLGSQRPSHVDKTLGEGLLPPRVRPRRPADLEDDRGRAAGSHRRRDRPRWSSTSAPMATGPTPVSNHVTRPNSPTGWAIFSIARCRCSRSIGMELSRRHRTNWPPMRPRQRRKPWRCSNKTNCRRCCKASGDS